jgi:dTDP-4-amino-4,6-dideoxygalactose transaminase
MGYSYRATELEGALGLGQMKRWRQIVGARKKHAKQLTKGLSPLSQWLQLPSKRANADHVFMMYGIIVKDGVDRDDLIFYLERKGIETRYLLPITNQPVYKKVWGEIEDNYPNAKLINQRGFYMGCHPDLTREDIDYVVSTFKQYFKKRFKK